MKPRKTKLRQEAAWRECQVRMPGCTGGPCVLAHVRMPGISGGSLKAPDFLGAWACQHCHDEADRRTTHWPIEQAELWFYEGVLRTQYQLWQESKIKEAA